MGEWVYLVISIVVSLILGYRLAMSQKETPCPQSIYYKSPRGAICKLSLTEEWRRAIKEKKSLYINAQPDKHLDDININLLFEHAIELQIDSSFYEEQKILNPQSMFCPVCRDGKLKFVSAVANGRLQIMRCVTCGASITAKIETVLPVEFQSTRPYRARGYIAQDAEMNKKHIRQMTSQEKQELYEKMRQELIEQYGLGSG